jgi:Icc-related predicted phosphoesterase
MSTHHVSALHDIHGNLPALEAVLNEVREAAVDQVIVGGDVLVGPMARETLRCLLDFETRTTFIYGNAEVAVLEQLAGRTPVRVPEEYRSPIRWVADQVQDY